MSTDDLYKSLAKFDAEIATWPLFRYRFELFLKAKKLTHIVKFAEDTAANCPDEEKRNARRASREEDDGRVQSYLINKLQPLPCTTPVIVTLNPPFEPNPARVLQEFAYSHPLLDSAAVMAQGGIAQLQGQRHTWYAGAWLGYGFHEDGLVSAHAVADSIARGETRPERTTMPMRVAA